MVKLTSIQKGILEEMGRGNPIIWGALKDGWYQQERAIQVTTINSLKNKGLIEIFDTEFPIDEDDYIHYILTLLGRRTVCQLLSKKKSNLDKEEEFTKIYV